MVAEQVSLTVDGRSIEVPAGGSLLDALRDHCGVRSAKDGCAPQGQCGCCTVWVDGEPRVACVTPVARVAGRSVTTLDGVSDAGDWAKRFCDVGASQCGFCTPGIIMRLASIDPAARTEARVRNALLAHVCRCTGWQTIVDAAVGAVHHRAARSTADAERRAAIEGKVPQRVVPDVALGAGGFAVDTAPPDALVAVRDEAGEWVVADTVAEARVTAGRVQGRRSTLPLTWPVDVPAGEWALTLQTTWVEPAYLEPDAAWCRPGGEPSNTAANGGAFGGKQGSLVGAVARRLADQHGRPVLAMLTRDDVVRLGPKRPPMAVALRADGSGVVHVVRTPGIADAIHRAAPHVEVHEVDAVGPPTSSALRAAGWAELAACIAVLGDGTVDTDEGATARAAVGDDGSIAVWVRCGEPLDEVVLRSYCIGAAHMALGWVRHEAIVVGPDGVPADVTIRSAGIVRAVDTPRITVHIEPDAAAPVNGSDAVFAAVAAAVWRHDGLQPRWPTMRA